MPRKNRTDKHRLLSIEKFDCNKQRYQNSKLAQKAAEYQMLENMTIELSVYKCDLCGYWHLTRSVNN